MSDESYIQSLFADRLGGNQFGKDTKIYKLEKIKRAKRAAHDANPGKVLFDKGLVYKGFKIMPYSYACTTVLSNFEANSNYKEITDIVNQIKID